MRLREKRKTTSNPASVRRDVEHAQEQTRRLDAQRRRGGAGVNEHREQDAEVCGRGNRVNVLGRFGGEVRG